MLVMELEEEKWNDHLCTVWCEE